MIGASFCGIRWLSLETLLWLLEIAAEHRLVTGPPVGPLQRDADTQTVLQMGLRAPGATGCWPALRRC